MIHFKRALLNIMTAYNASADGRRFLCQSPEDLIAFFTVT